MFELKLGTRSVAVKTIAEVQAYVDSGNANPDTAIRKAGATEWQKGKNVRGVDFSVPVATPGMTSSGKATGAGHSTLSQPHQNWKPVGAPLPSPRTFSPSLASGNSISPRRFMR